MPTRSPTSSPPQPPHRAHQADTKSSCADRPGSRRHPGPGHLGRYGRAGTGPPHTAREEPQWVERHVVLFSAVPDLLNEHLEDLVTLPYLQHRGAPIDAIRLYLDPVVLDEHDAALLDSEIATPALMRCRKSRADEGSTVEVVTTLVRPTAELFLALPVPAV
ncbi:UTRA domain-containing protein [Streptomyces chromofuscus]|uniref:UTRA domain-containing protein n=1 Tax=Streptomyces chromofuscus TaxID=42881 RepID=A0A7M2T753_STRCW|nr:UTRA domain-containing protein [Streptomyces chromofuscus]QOV44540.1 UTRA domain-containing protein [Streptomyces chromofuscus]GGT42478.1 hypothetical protein GCM10010254_72550 [Streptomyces chromofuscus]